VHCTGEHELLTELDTLCMCLSSLDVVEPLTDDGDLAGITHQLDLCVVCTGMFLLQLHLMSSAGLEAELEGILTELLSLPCGIFRLHCVSSSL